MNIKLALILMLSATSIYAAQPLPSFSFNRHELFHKALNDDKEFFICILEKNESKKAIENYLDVQAAQLNKQDKYTLLVYRCVGLGLIVASGIFGLNTLTDCIAAYQVESYMSDYLNLVASGLSTLLFLGLSYPFITIKKKDILESNRFEKNKLNFVKKYITQCSAEGKGSSNGFQKN